MQCFSLDSFSEPAPFLDYCWTVSKSEQTGTIREALTTIFTHAPGYHKDLQFVSSHAYGSCTAYKKVH